MINNQIEYKKTKIKEITVSGLPVELSNSQLKNYDIIRKQWKEFNKIINTIRWDHSTYIEKFGITKRINNKLLYIPSMVLNEFNILDKFIIPESTYLNVTHKGSMISLKETIYKIYKDIIPNSDFVIDKDREFIHFEKYDHNFKWNKENSIINILIPIMTQTIKKEF